jgi:hypothetical protein
MNTLCATLYIIQNGLLSVKLNKYLQGHNHFCIYTNIKGQKILIFEYQYIQKYLQGQRI